MSKSMLVVAAHPDDEILGCGATVAKLAAEGWRVHLAILGEGVTSRGASAEAGVELETLRQASRRAASILGAQGVEHFGLPDNSLDTVPLLSLVKIVEELVKRHRPELVLTHFPGDLNVDHQLVAKAVLTATRPLPGEGVREVLHFSVASSTEWAFGLLGGTYSPTVFYDVSEHWETKLRALEAYASEMRPFPHPRSAEAITAEATRLGSSIGVARAEAFLLARAIR